MPNKDHLELANMLSLHLVDVYGNKHIYKYDNTRCDIYNESGEKIVNKQLNEFIERVQPKLHQHKDKCSHDLYKKYKDPSHVRILLGSKCNYNCKYCKQERDEILDEYTVEDVTALVTMFKENISPKNIYQIQLWGGEPLIYKNTALELSKQLHALYPNIEIFTLSNGSLWTDTFVDDAISAGLMLGISHDGPGQDYRTGDPLREGSKSRSAILKYWEYVKHNPDTAFSILLTITDKNSVDLFATEQYFVDIFGDEILGRLNFLPLMIDNTSQHDCKIDTSRENNFSYRVLEYLMKKQLTPSGCAVQLLDFAKLFTRNHFVLDPEQVSCFIASPISLVCDMRGNIIPCQNYTAQSVVRGMSAKMGHISNMDTITHPKYIKLNEKQTKCMTCPVVPMCMGGCPLNEHSYLSDECKSNFVFYMGMLAYVVYLMTDMLIESIDGDFSCRDM